MKKGRGEGEETYKDRERRTEMLEGRERQEEIPLNVPTVMSYPE